MVPTDYNPFAPHGATDDMQSGLPGPAGYPEDGKIDDIMDWVGDDEDRASEALDHENSQDEPRVTLVEKLEKLTAEKVPDGSASEVLEWVGDDVARASKALDAENAGQKRKGLTNELTALLEPAEDDAEGDDDA